jgi:hypothetical protein
MHINQTAVASVLVAAGFSVHPPARAAETPLLWLAAGAHGTPCDSGLRCAASLDCDPASLRCRIPAQLSLSVTDIDGCDPDFVVTLSAHNSGEIALDEEVLVTTSVTGRYYSAECDWTSGDDWQSEGCEWGADVEGPINTSLDTARIQLPGGTGGPVQLPVHLSLPSFTVEANVSIEVDSSAWSVPYRERWSTPSFDPGAGTEVCY